MKIKLHLTGYAVAYDRIPNQKRTPDQQPLPGRPQGSLYSQQKHAIADAIEWMRLNAVHKPRIFVCTTPGLLEYAKEARSISAFCTNLRNRYDMRNYVWVREFTKRGYPHYHFVADMPQFDAVHLSTYWSGLMGGEANNSIRVGTRPDAKTGKRKYWITGKRMAWYMSKYFGKGLSEEEKQLKDSGVRFRTFAISQQARAESQPLIFDAQVLRTYRNTHERTFTVCNEQIEKFIDAGISPPSFNPHTYDWKWTGHGSSWTGFPKRDKAKK